MGLGGGSEGSYRCRLGLEGDKVLEVGWGCIMFDFVDDEEDFEYNALFNGKPVK